jgi:hypothetical protein
MTEITTKADLITALKHSNQRAQNWFLEIPTNNFFSRNGDVWSASDNVDHLIKAVKPIVRALKLPKFTLQAMFGKPDRQSKPYEEICRIYRDEIAIGAQASGKFLPNQETPTDNADVKKQTLMDQWSRANADLLSTVEKWGEAELDQYLLPHPILGKLTIREMLFFTIYHNLRHASQEGD